VIGGGNYDALVKAALRAAFPDVTSRRDRRALNRLVSSNAGFDLRRMVLDDPSLIGATKPIWLPSSGDIDVYVKGNISADGPESERRIKDKEIAWVKALQERGSLEQKFNTRFFTGGDSRNPEVAGIWGAVVGSFFTLLVTLALAFPLGVMAAVYLEEFAPKNRWTDLVEVNINNLAAVPSIVFGLLGLAVFLNFFHLPRSAPLVGGMVLALMTLPTIIIASRAALKAVPPSIREAALGIGASKVQTVTHHVLPLAMPGMLTGTIIGMAQALGETAPLLMIGMVAFIVDVPSGPLDPATVLPVQVYLWADSPERAFVEKTSAAIMVLLAFLICMNLLAILLRKRFERRW
jgi:phosphate transport system permease protein